MPLTKNALEIAEKRYFQDGEDWEACARRVGRAIAANEMDKECWEEEFARLIYEMEFIPGGRILRNSGKIRPSVLNCAVLPIGDSIEEIGETIKNALILWSYGAGIGIDFSPLRERGSPLKSKGGESSGMVSFLHAIDSVAHTIETGGQRRSGCLAMCKVRHPEIFEFVDAKRIDGELSYFNLSVAVDDSFLKAVENDEEWDLKFAGRTVRTVRAQDLWYKILDSMLQTGDPGLINYGKLIKNNSYYFQPISTTNLCGELPLPSMGACCLGSLVLPSFLAGRNTNWKRLEHAIAASIRFLDNVLDINYFPIPEMERITKESRRVGLGVMGLHDYLLRKQIEYGSEKSLLEIEKLFRFVRDVAYRTSCDLAQEKGAFPAYDRSQFSHASFVKKLPAKLRMYVKSNAIRNCSLLSAPPTGTTSLIAGVSSGIEPLFSLAYRREDRVSTRYYIHDALKEWLESGEEEKPEWLVDAGDLTPEQHLDVQVACQRFIDSAASKTVNVPESTTVEDLSKLLLEWIYDLKGLTVYRDGSKKGAPLNRLTTEEARKYLDESTDEDDCAQECRSGTCEL